MIDLFNIREAATVRRSRLQRVNIPSRNDLNSRCSHQWGILDFISSQRCYWRLRSFGMLRLAVRIIAPKFRRIITPWSSGSSIPRRNMEKCWVLLSLVYILRVSVCPWMCAFDGRLSTRSTWLYGATSKKGRSYLYSASSEHQSNVIFGDDIDLLKHYLTVKSCHSLRFDRVQWQEP
jgi:hypothetical protein